MKKEQGAYFLEAVLATPILFFMIMATLLSWITFTYAIMAQDSLTQTAIFVSSSGTWTAKQRLECERRLPGAAFVNGKLDTDYRYCRVWIANSKDASTRAEIKDFGTEFTPICPDWSAIDSKRTQDDPYLDKQADLTAVKDCLNEPGTGKRFALYSEHEAGGTQEKPILVEVSYRQWWLPYCFLAYNKDEEAKYCTQDTSKDSYVRRSVVVYSQTRRES